MSTSLIVNPVSISISWDYEQTGFPGPNKDVNSLSYQGAQLTTGTGAGNANIKYSAQLSIPASSNTTLNLSSLTDSLNQTINFVRIKSFYAENNSSASSTLVEIGNAATNPFSAIWAIPGTTHSDAFIKLNNGVCIFVGTCNDATAYPVGSGINLEVSNADGSHSALVSIFIAGCNA